MMYMTMKTLSGRLATIVFSLLAAVMAAAGPLDASLHLAVSALKTAESPIIIDDQAVFTSSFAARSVGVAFQHEEFKTVHLMERNRYGVYFLVFPLPVGTAEPLRYRLVVDGAWIRDPLNSETIRDSATGAALSVLRFDRISDEKPGVFRILDGRTATFAYRSGPGERIYVSGSFSDWDPFMYPMTEVEPGLYRLSLELPAGIQRYVFVVRGELLIDPLNPESAYSRDGLRVSVLTVP